MKNSEKKERLLISCSKSPSFLRDHLAWCRRMKKWYYWIAVGMVLIPWSLNLILPEPWGLDPAVMESNNKVFAAWTLVVCLGCFLGWLWTQGRIQLLLLIKHQQEDEQGDS